MSRPVGHPTIGSQKKLDNQESIIAEERNFVASFGVNITPIYRSQCSFLVQVGILDTVSCPIVVDAGYRFLKLGFSFFRVVAFLLTVLY